MKKLLSGIIVSVISMLYLPLISQTVNLAQGLVAYYPFTGNANDSAGNNHHGTVNGATLVKDRCGKSNSAYKFNGTSSFIEIPTTGLLNDRYSYSIWVNATIIPSTSNYTYPFAIGGTGGGQNISICNNALQGWSGGSYNNGTPSASLVAKGSQPDTGKWYHLVYIRDSVKIKLYINGVLNTNEATYNGNMNTNTGGNSANYGSSPKAYFGTRDKLSQFYFKGAVDDVRLYNRVINANEIDSLYHEKMCFFDTKSIQLSLGLVAYYPFTGNANDSSGNSHHGTVSGANLVKDRCGKSNSAYGYNGTNSYIEIPSTGLLIDNFSYSIWVNASEIPASGSYTYPFAIGGTGGGQTISICNNALQGWAGGSYNNGTPSASLVAVGSQPNTNIWYHLVYIRDINKIKLYVNGVLNTYEATYNGNMNTNTGGNSANYGSSPKAYFGTRDKLSQFYFKGAVDDVRLYNRVINANEIDSLYHEKKCFFMDINPSEILNFRIFPNPGSGIFNINIDHPATTVMRIMVVDQIGRIVMQHPIENESTHEVIDLNSFSNGVYNVIIGNENGYFSRKIVLSK